MPACSPCVWPPAFTAPDSGRQALGTPVATCYKRAATPPDPALTHSRPARPSQRSSADRAARPSSNPGETGGASLLGVGAGLSGLRPSTPGQELICSGIGLTLKLSLVLVAGVSLVRLAGAYQQRLDRYGEISAVLDIQQAKLLKAQSRFDTLFATGGEQRLIQEQDQWIAPNRMRVVWKQTSPATPASTPFPTVERP